MYHFYIVSIILFILLAPGILINMKGNKWVILLIHAVIFTVLLKVINDYLNDCRKKEKFADTGIPVWVPIVSGLVVLCFGGFLYMLGASDMPASTNVKNATIKLNQPRVNASTNVKNANIKLNQPKVNISRS
jgi:hypothetical protein